MSDSINKVRDILAKHHTSKQLQTPEETEGPAAGSNTVFYGEQKENGDIRLEFDVVPSPDNDINKEVSTVLENVAKGTIIATAPAASKPTALAQLSSSGEAGQAQKHAKKAKRHGIHDNVVVDVSNYDTWQTPAILVELSRGQEATIMIAKPNKGVNMSKNSVHSFWIETLLRGNDAENVYKLEFDGKFYRTDAGGWTTDGHQKDAGDWPFYGWTITANEELLGLGAFLLEGALLTCPTETLRYNEYEDNAYRFVIKVIE